MTSYFAILAFHPGSTLPNLIVSSARSPCRIIMQDRNLTRALVTHESTCCVALGMHFEKECETLDSFLIYLFDFNFYVARYDLISLSQEM